MFYQTKSENQCSWFYQCLLIFKIREDIFKIPLKMILFGDLAFEIKLFYLYSHFLNIQWLLSLY